MLLEFGESVFNETTAFDEVAVLRENLSYLLMTLDLEGVDILCADQAEGKIQEDCRPGEPFIVYSIQPSVTIQFINQQPCHPFFEIDVPLYQDDNVNKVINRICREMRGIKGK